jgi:hypothetical protein
MPCHERDKTSQLFNKFYDCHASSPKTHSRSIYSHASQGTNRASLVDRVKETNSVRVEAAVTCPDADGTANDPQVLHMMRG